MADGPLDTIILGGGPAGLTAGLYAARARVNAILLEKGLPGGSPLSTDIIENYPGFPDGVTGAELGERMQAQAERFGLEMRTLVGANKVVAADGAYRVETDEEPFLARSVIVAVGARPNRLGVPGEEEYVGRGVSFCATCDGAMFRDRIVAVVGGGNAAIEEAIFLTRFASKVLVVHRRDALRAVPVLQEQAFANEKIEFLWNSELKRVDGNDVVTGIEVCNRKTGVATRLNVQGVFIYIGTVPNSDVVADLVELDGRGFIKTDTSLMTSSPGIFACGDVRAGHPRQVVIATGEGAVAQMSAQRYLSELEG
ncbi:MAG: thioredoxin-disulfide reductase [Actinobacteria bacterium]|nr:MAG: thioredoxin-disulfide reductase [Actinomycetota bacterium]